MDSFKEFISYLKTVLPYTKSVRKHFFIVFFLSLVMTLAGIISPIISKVIVDKIFVGKNPNILKQLLIIMAVAFIIISVFNIINAYILAKLTGRLNYRIKIDFFDKMQNSSLPFYISKKSGEIQYRMFEDTELLIDYLLKIFINSIIYVIWIILVAVIMFRWCWTLACLVCGTFIVQTILLVKFREPLKEMYFKKKNIEQDVIGEVNEHFATIDLVKTLGLEKVKYNSISDRLKKLIDTIIRLTFLGTLFQTFSSLLSQLWSFGILWMGGNYVFEGTMTLGTFMGFYLLAGYLNQPITSLAGIIMSYQDVKVSFKRFTEYCQESENLKEDTSQKKEFKMSDCMELRNVTFSYNEEVKVLDGVSLILKPGNIIALTGRSGTGKTTFARIIARLLSPLKGDIAIDGVSIKELDYIGFRKNVGFLLQNAFIIDGTLLENLTIGLDEYTEQQLNDAVKSAGLSHFVEKMPEGLNTPLGIRGLNISLGEAQRIAIARLILRNPKIVILDEPTSFLDKETEDIILNSIIEFKKRNSLVIVIAHKESTINIADQVLWFENGKIDVAGKRSKIYESSEI